METFLRLSVFAVLFQTATSQTSCRQVSAATHAHHTLAPLASLIIQRVAVRKQKPLLQEEVEQTYGGLFSHLPESSAGIGTLLFWKLEDGGWKMEAGRRPISHF
jgi:hypothetical protein